MAKAMGDWINPKLAEWMMHNVACWPVATNFSLGPNVSFRGEAEVGREASPLPRSKMTHNGSVAELSGARVQSFRHDCPHISHLNLLEREPRRLRHIGVYCTVKLVERRSLNTALFQ